jgi:hypothetical protein
MVISSTVSSADLSTTFKRCAMCTFYTARSTPSALTVASTQLTAVPTSPAGLTIRPSRPSVIASVQTVDATRRRRWQPWPRLHQPTLVRSCHAHGHTYALTRPGHLLFYCVFFLICSGFPLQGKQLSFDKLATWCKSQKDGSCYEQ